MKVAPEPPRLGNAPDAGAPERTPDPAAPRPAASRYQLMEVLGRGGMGVVYRALDRKLGREVALKTLAGGRVVTSAMRERQLREARAVARLEHPGIVQLYDCFEDGGQLFLTMRIVRGPTLSSVIAQGPMAPAEAARIVAEVARTLAYAHEQGVTHRDIKPGNILLEQGRPVLMDFGLALSADSDDMRLTAEGQIMGTPAYMAPEQITGETESAGPAVDQYALGVTLYELLAGEPPYTSTNRSALFAAVLAGRPAPLPRAVPKELGRICARAIARSPSARFAGVSELATALDRWLAGARPFTLHDEASQLLEQATRQGRTLAMVAFGAALLLGAERGAEHLWQARQRAARWERAEQRRAAMEARSADLYGKGDDLSAEELFEAFVSLPENQETPALARAWLDRGARLIEAGDSSGALSALTTAHGVAPERTGQVAALVALARTFHAAEAWDGLRGALSALDRRGYRGAELAEVRRDLALTGYDLRSADQEAADPGLAPLLALLRRAAVTNLHAATAERWDLDGDGIEELCLSDRRSPNLQVVGHGGASLPVLRELRLEPGGSGPFTPTPARGVALPRPLAVTRSLDGCALVTPEGDHLERLLVWPCTNAGPVAAGDLDGDGVIEMVVGDDRALLRLDPASGVGPTVVNATINSANSEVNTVNLIDLDRDGRAELVLGSGNWGAYDLRVMRPSGDALPVLARAQLGEIWGVGEVRTPEETWVAAAQTHDPTSPLSRQIFGQHTPHGAPQGVYLYAWRGGALLPRGALPWPTPPRRPLSAEVAATQWLHDILKVGDIDGDGVNEIALGVRASWTVVYRMRPDHTWAKMSLDGLFPLDFSDVDGDGEEELLVRRDHDGVVVVLGAGDGPLPRLQAPALTRETPPADMDPDLVGAWERAEDIVEFGVTDVAVDRFEALARLGVGTPIEGLALMRGAAVLAASGETVRALSLYSRAAELPESAASALEAGARICLDDAREEDALRLMDRRLALPDPPAELRVRVESLRARVSEALETVDFREGLKPDWRVDDPLGVSLGADGLRIRTNGDRRELHRPVTWRGGHARLSFSVKLNHQDWSAQLAFGVAPPSELAWTNLSLLRVGGGGVYNSSFTCDHLPGGGGLDYVPDAVNTVTWEYSPEEGRGSCTLTVDGHEESRRSYAIPADAIRPGPLDLVISVKAETALTDVLVVSVAYSGFDPREEPTTPVEVAAGHLARGAPDRALAALGGASTEALLPSLIALNRLGRTREADALLARGVATGALSMEMKRQLLLVAPDRFGAAMRSALGAGWCEAFGEAWQTVVTAHPDEPRTINTLLSGLTGVERSGACGADLGLQAELLLWRTGAYRRDGSLGEAREDAEHAAEIFRREPAMSQALYRAERERALALVAEGDTRAAMDGILAALRVSTSPESAADVVVHTPGLAPLRSLPGWAEIEAFRKLGPAEN